MKKQKLWVSSIAGLLAAVLLMNLLSGMLPGYVNAESSGVLQEQLDALEAQKEQVAEQIAALQSQISQNSDEMEAVVAQKNLIDQEIFLLYQQVQTINSQISAYGLLIADKQDELVQAQAELAELNQKNKERIRAMEENGNLTYWSVLFKANSIADLLDRLNMIEEIAEADRQRLQQMSKAAQAVADAKAELETQKSALEDTRTELDATQAELENKRAEADQLLEELLAKGQQFQNLLEQSEEEQSGLMEQIAQKEKEYDNAKYQEWLATSVPETTKPSSGSSGSSNSSGGSTGGNTVSGITWLVPINYTAFTSPFGYRWHPLSGEWRMHYGVDLAAPTGTPIYATRSGVVTTASYEDGGAGYYVSINHGDGYASIYMHMTHYIVSAGQYVSAGQVIGYCGSTGGSTGPHLHFGISYNGSYVNPANYINI